MRMLRLLPIGLLLLAGCFEGQKPNIVARNGKQVTELIAVPPHSELPTPPVPPIPPPPPDPIDKVPVEKPPVEKPPVEKPPVDKPVEKPPVDKDKPDPAPKVPLYDRLGKEPGITQIVDDFVANVVADPDIKEKHKKHFQEGDVLALKNKLIDQIGEATGGPQKYTGKNMKEAHKGLEITNKDFDALANDLAKAFDKNKIDKDVKDTIMKVVESMRKDVVEKED